MKLFFKQAIVFLGILVAVNFLLFFLIRGFYIKDYDEVDLAYPSYLLADSHGTPLGDFTENHQVHNFSGQSDSYLDMERKLKFLIRNTEVKKVYITVDDHTLSPTRENQNNLDRSAYYTEADDYSNYGQYIKEKYLNYYCVFLNDRYSLVIKNFIQDELFNVSKWGGVRSKSSWEKLSNKEQITITKDRVKNYFEFPQPSARMSESLMRIISLCKEKDIELIGLRFPLTKTYVDLLNEESYEADSLMSIHQLQVIDLDSLYLEQDSLFRDMDHLDKKGGEKFAKVLFEKKTTPQIKV
ncbi:hypothetical protein SAMN04489724_2894 [Algoriphagus locisalis]|uniref:SGNH/GDSL hydrolase family protein n=1 Tax=Algoriphagus locisalis TaxID=305507 RepID=A0A1I7BZQ4_9BACT|nr:hypothetical protein [Algoriphagus locisalis]SFT92673.1 hypothetical protein SAMN04489724_2894 [Algoriphagus locisalis]